MIDLSERIIHELKEESHKARVPFAVVVRVFFEAYEEHKQLHGSFKHHPHYHAKMTERYEFMRQEGLRYIQEHRR